MKLFNMLFLIILSLGAEAVVHTTTRGKEPSIRVEVYDTRIGENVLIPLVSLEEDVNVVIEEKNILSGANIEIDGVMKKSRGRYIRLLEAEGLSYQDQLKVEGALANGQKLYIYEWNIHKNPFIQALYPDELPYGVSKVREPFAWDSANPSGTWAYYSIEAINNYGMSLVLNPPRDMKKFCPKFKKLTIEQRKYVWVHLLNQIAERESAFDPSVGNDESQFERGNGLTVISRGLLQISFRSSQNPKYVANGCLARTAAELHDPRLNLGCGIAIMTYLTSQNNCLSCQKGYGKKKRWKGVSAYWSTMRSKYKVGCKFCSSGTATVGYRKEIANAIKKLPICRK